MKRLILGKKAAGKTMFIVNHVIPALNGNYKVVDFCKEYHQWIKDPEKIITFPNEVGKGLYKLVHHEVTNFPDDQCLILDNSSILIKPLELWKGEVSWLPIEASKKDIIIVSESVQEILDRGLQNYFDEVYVFPIHDYSIVMDQNLFSKTPTRFLSKDYLRFPIL